jgi:predicted RNA-binding protein with RPS1 domain
MTVNKKAYSFSLTEQEMQQINYFASINGFKNGSSFISHLVNNYAYSSDPIKEINSIKQKKEELQIEVAKLEKKEREALSILEAHKTYEKELKTQEAKAIDIIKHNIIQGANSLEIENIAKHWGFRLNKDYKELIYKSLNSIKQIAN